MPQEGSTFVKQEGNTNTRGLMVAKMDSSIDNNMEKSSSNGVGQPKHLISIGCESLLQCDEVITQDNRHTHSSHENAYFTQSIIETSNSNSEICAQVKFDKPPKNQRA